MSQRRRAPVDPIDALIDDINAMDTAGGGENENTSDNEGVGGAQGHDDDVEDDVALDDLDRMIMEIEGNSKIHRRTPTVSAQQAQKQHYGGGGSGSGASGSNSVARKNPNSRKRNVQSALDGADLDRILEDIQNVSKLKAKAGMKKLGWGVVSAERKFDLVAPRYILENQEVKATLVVTTTGGERALIPREDLQVSLSGSDAPVQLIDREDGTWLITFPTSGINPVHLVIHTYGQEQFNWKIEIGGQPVAAQCEAVATGTYKLNHRCEMTIVAKDAKGQQLKIGGAKFALSFAGAGQLNDVGLLDKMDGSYALTFVPNAVGHYGLFVSLDGEDIKGSPINFMVSK